MHWLLMPAPGRDINTDYSFETPALRQAAGGTVSGQKQAGVQVG